MTGITRMNDNAYKFCKLTFVLDGVKEVVWDLIHFSDGSLQLLLGAVRNNNALP